MKGKVLHLLNKSTFQELYITYYKQLVVISFNILENKEDAEDVVQHVFLRMWHKRNSIEVKGEISPYLIAAVRNRSFNVLEKYKSRTKYQEYLSSTKDNISQRFPDPFFLELLERQIQSLPPKCRLIFRKSRLDGMKNKEIASELNLSIKTIENQIGKAIGILREVLKDYFPTYILVFFLKIYLFY